jgi:hypothetical protein
VIDLAERAWFQPAKLTVTGSELRLVENISLLISAGLFEGIVQTACIRTCPWICP